MEQEWKQKQEKDQDSLKASLTLQVTRAQQQYQQEAQQRATLQVSLERLKEDHSRSVDDLKKQHRQEIAKLDSEWQEQREELLEMIQRDCNAAFEQHYRKLPSAPTPSRRQSPLRPSSMPARPAQRIFAPSPLQRRSMEHDVAQLISPAYSDMDTVLRETEEMIQSL